MNSDDVRLFQDHLRDLSLELEELVTFEVTQFKQTSLLQKRILRLKMLYPTFPEPLRKLIDENNVIGSLQKVTDHLENYGDAVEAIKKHTGFMENILQLLQKDSAKIDALLKESLALKSELETRDMQVKEKDVWIQSLLQQISNPSPLECASSSASPHLSDLPEEDFDLQLSLDSPDQHQLLPYSSKKVEPPVIIEKLSIATPKGSKRNGNRAKSQLSAKLKNKAIKSSILKRHHKTPIPGVQLRPFFSRVKCYFCSKQFYKINLYVHLKKHTTEKPYTCPMKDCEHEAVKSTTVIQHIARVHREKSFKCSKCRKTFNKTADLSLHNHVDHLGLEPVKCSDCYMTFMTKNQQLKHYMCVHKNIKPYKCPKCHIQFQSFYLRKHFKTKHNKIIGSLSSYRTFVIRGNKIVMLQS